MKTIETTATVADNGSLTLQMPPEIVPGKHKVVVVVDEETVEAKKQRSLEIPVIHLGKWPENLSLRREDLYGDDGR